MNWLLLLEGCLAGVLSGIVAWLVAPGLVAWNLSQHFQSGLLVSGVFAAMFAGAFSALPTLIMERNPGKATNYWISSSSVALAVTMLGTVIFVMLAEILVPAARIPIGVQRFFWWMCLSGLFGTSFGLIQGSTRTFCVSLIGLTPAFIIAGTLIDQYFIPQDQNLLGFIFLGVLPGFGLALSFDLLKDAWLDEYPGSFFLFRYYLDRDEFVAGTSQDCDLTLFEGSENTFVIMEKDGVHILEVPEEQTHLLINRSRFRYRTLVDGDSINIGDRTFIYHSKLARSRDILPQATA